MSDKLTITSVSGGGDGPDLKGCYFKTKSDGTVDFYDKNGTRKNTGVGVGSLFSVTLDEYPGITWNLTISQFSIEGTWSNPPGFEEIDGTYQAQASGTGADEEEGAASANA